jgi:glucokinase
LTYIAGLDLGGTKCAISIANDIGEILGRQEFSTPATEAPELFIGKLLDALEELARENKVDAQTLAGIGISCGGPLDRTTGTILRPPNLPSWEAVPVRDLVQKRFPGLRVELDNDANATALAEWNTMVFMTVGTGIGAGLILDGRLYHGTNDLAGEVGHQTIKIDGPLCACGKRGCLEALASGPAVARLAREGLSYGRGKSLIDTAGGNKSEITARHVVDLAKAGDSYCRSILEEAGTYLGIGIANVIQILNPEAIVLGTLAIHAGDLLLDPVRRAASEFAWLRSLQCCKIVPAELGDRAQDLAALCLVIQ